jgi:O-antigen ligase
VEKAAFTIYLIVLMLSPLLFGAVSPYAYTTMTLGVLTASLFLLRKNMRKDIRSHAYRLHLPASSLTFLFLSLLLFLFFQIVPLPDALLGLLSPEARVVAHKSLPASSVMPPAGPIRAWFPLAPYIHPVRLSIVRWTTYGLFFLGLTQVLNSRKRIERIILFILVLGGFEALYGLVEAYSGSSHILWFKKGADRIASGTYINRNHFAGLMEMCLLLAAGYAAALGVKEKERTIPSGGKPGIRVRISRFLSREQQFNKRAFILFTGVIIGLGLVFSASRGGILGAARGLLCLALLYVFRRRHRRKGFLILSLFLVTSFYAVHIGAEKTINRFRHIDEGLQHRKRVIQRSVELIGDYRATGIGLGNFPHAYPKYQAAEGKGGFLPHAHNDWVQFLAESGITGFLLMVAGVSYFLYYTLRLYGRREDPFAVCLGAVPLAAMTALGIHSWFDFNLHIPANFLMLTAVTAVGHSALHSERHHGHEKSLIAYHVIPLKYKGLVALLLVLALILGTGYWTIRHFVAECYCATSFHPTLNRDSTPPLEEIKTAVKWDGANAGYWWKLAWERIRIRDDQDRKLGTDEGGQGDGNRDGIQLEIVEALERAVRLNPFRAEYHVQTGWEYTRLASRPDYEVRWLPAADRSMERAAYFAGELTYLLHEGLGNYWVVRSKSVRPLSPEWHAAWARVNWHYRRALLLGEGNKGIGDRIRKYIWTYYPDEAFIKQAME